jgi:hypothetical protein
LRSLLNSIEERYFGEWGDWEDILSAFAFQKQMKEPEVIYAYYSYEDYSGTGVVIYKLDDKYYLVEGSHCSCNGLEGQWEPTEYENKEELLMLLNKSWYSYKEAAIAALNRI